MLTTRAMKVRRMARPTTKTKKAPLKSYKGHRAGSRIGQLHECFDREGEKAARRLGKRLGLEESTLRVQFSYYRNRPYKTVKVSKRANGRELRA